MMWRLIRKTEEEFRTVDNIRFRIVRSSRRTLGISILPDSSVIVRVPFRTSLKVTDDLVRQKAPWIKKHLAKSSEGSTNSIRRDYADGVKHLFRGKEYPVRVVYSKKPNVRFDDDSIVIELDRPDEPKLIGWLLYQWYRNEAVVLFPEMVNRILSRHTIHGFKPSGLKISTMKRRWGSCSSTGIITLNTELIKLPDRLIEHVIVHELCHLKHHNHGQGYYGLLARLEPGYKELRKELKSYVI